MKMKQFHSTKQSRHLRVNSNDPDLTHKIQLFKVAVEMKKSGLADIFIVNAIRAALEFEGVADLIHLWSSEEDVQEKDEIIADIQDMVDACNQPEKSKAVILKLNNLKEISQNIRSFKDSLLNIVMERGGLTHLSELTGIPQPSLSRFFNSNAVPQRATLLKIAKALNLNEIQIDLNLSQK